MKYKHLIQIKIETNIPLNQVIDQFPKVFIMKGTERMADGGKVLEAVEVLNVIKVAEMV